MGDYHILMQFDIDAEPEQIWDLLTDGPAYPSWNPAVLSFEGRIAVGERIGFSDLKGVLVVGQRKPVPGAVVPPGPAVLGIVSPPLRRSRLPLRITFVHDECLTVKPGEGLGTRRRGSRR